MGDAHHADLDAIATLASADPPPVVEEMTAHGRERDVPVIGPVAGRTLRLLARAASAERVFEFGSGFGYSAAWWAGALPDSGQLVLTDFDEDNLADARRFLARSEWTLDFRFELGDATETFERYEGPFDAVLFDHGRPNYVDTFEAVRHELAPGGFVVADNMFSGGTLRPATVRSVLDGEDPPDEDHASISRYVEHARDDPAFETTLLPVGNGLLVSHRL